MADNQRLIDALNEDRARELGAIMQYMLHHYTGQGIESASVNPVFKDIAMVEMKHAERLAERISYLGGDPVSKPKEIVKGGDLRKMINDDLANEREAIKNYREHISLCEEMGDTTTQMMLEEILSQEEDHADQWETLLGIRGQGEEAKFGRAA